MALYDGNASIYADFIERSERSKKGDPVRSPSQDRLSESATETRSVGEPRPSERSTSRRRREAFNTSESGENPDPTLKPGFAKRWPEQVSEKLLRKRKDSEIRREKSELGRSELFHPRARREVMAGCF